ncbi:chromate efflux transporter [Neomegalonema sp.]|uniref:chromate efflux transporter n=1 Tax=Neomegalonema sp. TaxID=2039713 RepID=UPI00262C8A47|nr:chromate efflux transporter [Neomegalonema sp.]MDD2869995.1 chromate efflux transporter [Neomegalonema sp.]
MIQAPVKSGSAAEVFLVFLRLGLTSFGGPVAHLAYFHEEFVRRRRWIDEQAYADLVALCQFLPGPTSSQVGFSLGVSRSGGLSGGLAAWLGFTLPSALVLLACATGAAVLSGPLAAGALHGLKLVAVAVVAQAVWGMARSLTPDRPRAGIALAAVGIVSFLGGPFAQVGAILCGALAGFLFLGAGEAPSGGGLRFPASRRQGLAALALFAILLILPGLTGAADRSQGIALFDGFYRAGALVFGGGHVVLPLLEAETVARGWVDEEAFLAGYGLAQAVPGPLFAFAAWLGALTRPPPDGALGASIALIAVFAPGLLLVYGASPFWEKLRAQPAARRALTGANAAVVGVLGAALHDPVWTSAVLSPQDFALALGGFLLLMVWKAPSWAVVLGLAAAGAVLSL